MMSAYDNVVVSHTARGKTSRYLDEYSLRQLVKSPPGNVYLHSEQNRYFVPVDSASYPWTDRLVIVVSIEGNEAVVVTQTSDHYNFDLPCYHRVPAVGEIP